MKYLAIEIKGQFDTFVDIFNDNDELGGLIDNDVDFKVLGTVCDDKEFGDMCTTDCDAFRYGVCRSKLVRDRFGKLWHVIPS